MFTVIKKSDELKPSYLQPKCHMNDVKVSVCSLKENFVSCSLRIEISENQTLTLIVGVVELQRKQKSQPHRVSSAKMKALGRSGTLRIKNETHGMMMI